MAHADGDGALLADRVPGGRAGADAAFLDTWKASTTTRWCGGLALGYGLVVLVAGLSAWSRLDGFDVGLFLLLAISIDDGLLNVLPGGFSRFKEQMQDARVHRHQASARADDRALFGTVNFLLGLASLVMAAVVDLYKPADLATVAVPLAASILLTAALVAGALRERRAPRLPALD